MDRSAIEDPPFLHIEGVGRRRLHYCREVHDAHTSGELVAYQTLWTYARKNGRAEPAGYVADLGLSTLCRIWKTDHKNAKRLLAALQEKQNLEVVRQPDYKRQLATRYRVFNSAQVMERRRARGLVWVVRTRSTRFVDLETVARLVNDPMGEQPMGISLEDD